jgi:uncharacterized membrane protein
VTEDLADSSTGLGAGRVEAFSDGVLAIAITLLVLDLRVPERGGQQGSLLHALTTGAAWSSYAAYLVSFAVLGITWVNHHSLFRRLIRVDRPMLFLNLGLLLGLSLLPFPTSVLARYLTAGGQDAHVAAFFYSLVMFYVSVMFSAIWWHATAGGGRLLPSRMSPQAVRASRRRFGLGVVFYAPTLGLSFVSAPLTLAVHGMLALYYVFEQLGSSNN